ncbi:hypothetical protein N9Y92_03625 [Chlamydiales bacterium]|nr:hypothetical protein [Chlamydiales bacterium]
MLTQVLGATAAGAMLVQVLDAITPMSMQDGRKISVILNWATLGMTAVGTIVGIWAYVVGVPNLFAFAVLTTPFLLIGAYHIKQHAYHKSIEEDTQELDELNESFEQKIARLEKSIRSQNNLILKKQVQITELQKSTKGLKTLQETNQKILQKKTEEADCLQGILKKFKEKMGALTGQVQTFSQTAKELRETKEEFKEGVDKIDTLAIDLTKNVERLSEENEETEGFLKILDQLFDDIDRVFNETASLFQKSNQAVKDLDLTVNELKDEIDQLKLIAQTIGKEVDEAVDELDKADSTHKKVDDLGDEMDEYFKEKK